MTRSIFGWDLPPGCTQRHIDEAAGVGFNEFCECCGLSTENCICPECPNCGSHGDPDCYTKDGDGASLDFSTDQLIGQTRLQIARCLAQLADLEQHLDWLKEKKEDSK